MSSSNHPTSDIEDAFSSNFPNYTPTSPDYFPASSRNIFSDFLQISYLISPSSSVRSSSPVRSTTPPPNYPLMPPKRTSTSEAPAMTQAAIRKLVANSVAAALEAQAATMASTNNPKSRLRM
ncbi:hypothetical protein Tco_0782218 [Tanacetum coccineum]